MDLWVRPAIACSKICPPHAGVAAVADVPDSKSGPCNGGVGSSPTFGTKRKTRICWSLTPPRAAVSRPFRMRSGASQPHCRQAPYSPIRRPHGAFDAVIRPATSTMRPWVRFRRSGRNLISLENDLFRLDSQGNRILTSGIQGQAKAVVVRAVRRFVRVAVRRPAIRRVVVPTAATVHPVRALLDRPPPTVVTRTAEIANS